MRVLISIFILFIFMNLGLSQTQNDIENWNRQGEIYYKKAIESNKEKTFYFEKALSQFLLSKNKEKIAFCYNILGTEFYYEENTTGALKFYKLAWDYVQLHFAVKDEVYIHALSNIPIYFETKGDFENALKYYNKYLNALETHHNDELGLIIGYINLGHFYQTTIGDHQRAYLHYLKVIELSKINKENDEYILELHAGGYGNAAFNLKELQQFDQAISFCKTSLSELSKLGRNEYTNQIFWYNYQNLSEIYLEKSQLDSASFYAILAAQILQEDDSIFEDYRTYQIQGNIYLQQKDKNKAITFFQKAIASAKNESEVYKYANVINHIGNIYSKFGQFDLALQNYQKGLVALSTTLYKDSFPSSLEIYKNPDIESYIYKKNALEILQSKASTFLKKYKTTLNKKDLLASFESFSLASEIIQIIRQDYAEDISKYNLAEKTLPIYEDAIGVSLELFTLTNDFKYKEIAFQFAESNKSVLLMESIRENAAKGFGILPDSILEKENQLKINLTFLEKQIRANKQSGKSFQKIESNHFDKKRIYNNLIATIEKEYPKYHQLKYGVQKVSIKKIQNEILDSESVLLEFFVGEKNIYLFALSRENLNIEIIPKKEDFIAKIHTFRQLLIHPPQSNTYISDLKYFQETTTDIYNHLLKNTLSNLPKTINRLIIIPDDYLNVLPFGILNTNDEKTIVNDYKSINYLMRTHVICYSYSATLLLDNFSKKYIADENFIGFAPSYNSEITAVARNCTEDELSFLRCNQKEVTDIQNIVNGNTFLGLNATKSAFRNFSKNVNIIHLATHACIDKEDNNFNRIYFQDDFLSNSDLTNMQINANLAVLSACNTGNGKLIKGEGVMSLCKGFTLAGVPSIVMSLWSIDDCSTSEVMVNFYTDLSKEKNKDNALRTAKLKYLNQADTKNTHPYYWAAFLQFGNNSPLILKKEKNTFTYLILAGGAILISLLIIIKFLPMKSNSSI